MPTPEIDSSNTVKRWTLAIAAHSKLTASERLLGAVIGQHANYKTGTVYIGSERLAHLLGTTERKVKERRRKIKNGGWMLDTGNRVGRATVYQLAIPTVPSLDTVPDSGNSTVLSLGTKGAQSRSVPCPVEAPIHTKEPTKVPIVELPVGVEKENQPQESAAVAATDLTSPALLSESAGSGATGKPECPCGATHDLIYRPRIHVAGVLHHDILVCPEIAVFGGVGNKDAHLVIT